MHGWKLSRCVNVNQLLIERAISHLCPHVEVSNFSRSTLNEKLVFSRLIKVASLTIFFFFFLFIFIILFIKFIYIQCTIITLLTLLTLLTILLSTTYNIYNCLQSLRN